MTKFLIGSMFVGIVLGLFGSRIVGQRLPAIGTAVQSPARVFSDSLKGVGYFRDSAGKAFVTLSDGSTVESQILVVRPSGWEAETAEHIWVRGIK